jgi:hypothetical protein
MAHKGRCRVCHRRFQADHRVGTRQVTCGAAACRSKRKQLTNRRWGQSHPEYERERQEKERAKPRSRKKDRRRYRKSHPEYAKCNGEYVRRFRDRQRARRAGVSSPSRVLRVNLTKQSASTRILAVRYTSRDVHVTLSA